MRLRLNAVPTNASRYVKFHQRELNVDVSQDTSLYKTGLV